MPLGKGGSADLGVHKGMSDKSTKVDNTGVKQFGSYPSVNGSATREGTAKTPASLGPRKA